ncbi:YitT family protein [Maritimibacter sp. UBA3975]|uniref:YitT family protein n=1 Tax=Maritimibacter sp. UBA3975 TaxID=1946833 RepID=UPI000C0A9E53|nr:YitT family protein [Maritimibacter sp. UBA3975]MAM60476.1 membrane protein [Maritimibacter sp.]|tara:strand:+ start:10342 stop:10959 length:618 start_codon:yes stop_codon:yes gene_type:complete
MLLLSAPPDRHSLAEDAVAFVIAAVLVALGIQFLQTAGLFTGQIAGAALILSYIGGWSFGVVFFLLNLPFYVFAALRMGWMFTIKSFIAVMMMSSCTELFADRITLDLPHPVYGAIIGSVCAGLGLLSFFRHGASLGGVGMLALYLQDRFDFRAGLTQLIFDAGIFVVAFFLFEPTVVLWSLLGAAFLNVIIALNHRRDRYIARS